MLKWDFTKLSTDSIVVNEHIIEESFTHLSIHTDTAQVQVVPTAGNAVRVTCRQWAKEKHTVTVQDGTLSIEVVDTRKWYDHIGIHMDSPTVTVELPIGEYGNLTVRGSTGDVDIPPDFRFATADIALSTGCIHYQAPANGTVTLKTDTGRIRVEDVTVGVLDVTVSTGQTQLVGVRCDSLTSVGNTGSIGLQDVIVAEAMNIRRSTGDVTLTDCDSGEMVITTNTGDVEATLLRGKTFVTHTDTGRVTVPDIHGGGRCEITTDTGDIRVEINP